MGRSPAFQFYANDWLSSTKIALMTPSEEGAYIRLLAHAWNCPDCSLPDDDEKLALLSRLGEAWKGSSQILRECFIKHPDNPSRLINKRLFDERQKQAEWRAKCAEGGIKSGESRRCKTKGSSRVGGSKREVNTNSSSSSSSSSSNSNTPFSPLLVEMPDTLHSDTFSAMWQTWVAHRLEKKEPLTPTSTRLQLKKLAKMGEARAIAALEHSIAGGWTGIFEPDKPRQSQSRRPVLLEGFGDD